MLALMRMSFAVSRAGLCARLLAFVLVLLVAPGPLGADPGVKSPAAQGPDALLNPPATDDAASRSAVLADLFERLRAAADEGDAALVAEAIEKIWEKSGSDTVDLLMARAGAMVQEEKLDVALDILDSVVAIAPDYAEGWNRRATVFFMKRDFRRSLDDLRRVLALEPRHFKAINGLGLIMQELGDKEAALQAFRQVLRLHPRAGDTKQLERELAREVEGQGI